MRRLLFFIISIAIFPLRISMACGPSIPQFDGYTFIHPAIINVKASGAPFFSDFDAIRQFYKGQTVLQEKDNISEWYDVFCEVPEKEDIKSLIYDFSAREVAQLQSAIIQKDATLTGRLVDNSFANYLKRNKCTETAGYLVFAKNCEPHVTFVEDEWAETYRDYATMDILIEDGLRYFKKTKSHYIKLRYAYQLVRLAHYKKDYEKVLKLYDYLMPKIDKRHSIIEYWILGHKAGALQALGNRVEAAYLYLQIFQNCESKRESAYRSFEIRTNEEWQQCLLLCQDDKERATLHALRSNKGKSNLLQEMQAIYDLHPDSEHLEILLANEMRQLEKQLLGRSFSESMRHQRRYYQKPDAVIGQRIIALQDFARKVRLEKKVQAVDLWHLAEAYLEFLAGDYYAADKTLKEVAVYTEKPILKEQIEVFQLAREIANWEYMDSTVELRALSVIRDNDLYAKYPDFPDFLNDKLAQLYTENNHPGKAFRVHYDINMLKPNPDEKMLDDLLMLAYKQNKNRFEQRLVQDENYQSYRDKLTEIKATLLFSEGQTEAALEVMKQIDRLNWDDYGLFNPFIEHINDCVHNCPPPADSIAAQLFNKGEIMEQLGEWEYKARSEPENGAFYFYRLGMAYYNMTYFGHAWGVMDYFRSGSSYSRWNLRDKDHIFPYYGFPYGNKEIMDVSIAKEYFERAIELATQPEVAARAVFWAAKCDQKLFYMSADYQAPRDRNQIPNMPETYRFYYRIMEAQLSQTTFYQEVIEECKYFEYYSR